MKNKAITSDGHETALYNLPISAFLFFPESSLSQADKQPLKIMNLWITWLCAELASYGEKKKKKTKN